MKIIRNFSILYLTVCAFICFALEKENSLEQKEKELKIAAREYNNEFVKNYCIKKWSDKESIEALSKFGTITELCSCTQDEMNYLTPEIVSVNLLKMQIQIAENSPNLYLNEEQMANTLKQWSDSWSIANRTCSEKIMRRKK